MSDNVGPNTLCEMEKRIIALSTDNILKVFDYICYDRCAHSRNCRNNFASDLATNGKIKAVRDLRHKLWMDPQEFSDSEKLKKLSARDYRNVTVIENLFKMKDAETNKIEYRIGYDRVSNKMNIS